MAEPKLIDILRAKHPEFATREQDLAFYLAAYEGGREYVSDSGRVFKHQREHPEDYADRVKRAAYFNYCEPIIAVWLGHIFRRPIERKTEQFEQALEDFSDNVDRMGSDLRAFMKEEVAANAQTFGYTFVLVDKAVYGPDIQTQADEMQAGVAMPYFSSISPQVVTNWAKDRYGQFLWLRYKEELQESPEWNQESKKRTLYWTWTRTECLVHEVTQPKGGGALEARLIQQVAHPLGEVPIVTVYNRRSKRTQTAGISGIQDIAFLNRTIANVCSLIDEFLYRQCFNILAMPASGRDTGESVAVGVNNLLYFDAESGVSPQYIMPATDPARYMMDWIDRVVQEIYRIAKVQAGSAEPTEQSGVSKSWDFHETDQNLADKADNLEHGETEMWRLWAKWQGKESDIQPQYPSEFDVQAVNAQLEEALALKALNPSRKFVAEEMKRLVRKINDSLDAETLQQIDEEIDSMGAVLTPDEESLARQTVAQLGGTA